MRTTIPFEITSWDQESYDADEQGVVELARATVAKTFSGDLAGTSTAQVLIVTAKGEPAAYTAVERVVGTLDGRTGGFVLVHGAAVESEVAHGQVVEGSGTGELAGIRGTAEYAHDETGARVTLDVEFEPQLDGTA
jgi:hypothetical protein